MRETGTDLERLQALLSESIERASAFLRESFEMPAHSLSAAQLAAHLDGALTVALATVTARGEPRVSPIGAVFVRGSFCVPTVAESARARHLARRPAASLTYYEGVDMAVIAHGEVEIITTTDEGFEEIDAALVQSGRESPREWGGHAIYVRLAPATIYTYARHPERFAPS
ncbi:MAG TPA: pyridoxamine 5'-phosphate oxidase family protein [Solirubrobacteraceae bacterium]|jgi:pyridoxine/pyridoxamine 5'-phosphate oxidase|nr:pyridoxamine 5'-phosphate oxidase family protein [Solirubrobacteraceae bacterium]